MGASVKPRIEAFNFFQNSREFFFQNSLEAYFSKANEKAAEFRTQHAIVFFFTNLLALYKIIVIMRQVNMFHLTNDSHFLHNIANNILYYVYHVPFRCFHSSTRKSKKIFFQIYKIL